MSFVFVPERCAFFLGTGGPSGPLAASLARAGERATADLVVPPGRRARVRGVRIPLLDAVAHCAAVRAADVDALPAALAAWTIASKLALDLVARERVVPVVRRAPDGAVDARWSVALTGSDDAANVAALARSLPPAAHALPLPERGTRVWPPAALLRAFLDATADALVRLAHAGAPSLTAQPGTDADAWIARWLAALTGPSPRLDLRGFGERHLADALDRWSAPALGADERLRACFRLELPERDRDPFILRFLLQSPDDPSLLVLAREAWRAGDGRLHALGRAFRDPQESLLEALGRAARLYPPLARSLEESTPERLELDAARAWQFLAEGATRLAQAGFGVIVPGELTAAGQRRLRMRMRVGAQPQSAGAVAGAGLGFGELVQFRWEAAIGDEPLSERELEALARQKSALVRHRGAWVAIDPQELADIRTRLRSRTPPLRAADALRIALGGEARGDGVVAPVVADGAFARALDRLRHADREHVPLPTGLRATLRPYQQRGYAWLVTMSALGLGACLADDMGLGKTVQMLAWLLHRRERFPQDARPALLVAPTSVLGNWEREVSRFAPDLAVVRHYGGERARSAAAIPARAGTLVVTSYGLLRRDADLLAAVPWSAVVLDEAQNVKNAASATARAARALAAPHRYALTGTPIENRLAELWSILEFANPGLLGPLETFRREYAVPIERYGNDEVAERLRRIAAPFVLRRVKSDPAIIDDLPAKNEMRTLCTLTREQASLYRAVVDDEMRRIEEAEGIERRGRVLALLTYLKQICNHPAQYLGEQGPLPRRSGKLARLTEMLEEAIAEGDRALVFTQYREMGERLVTHLEASLATEIQFLHGGTPQAARERMIARFQADPHGPRVFVLSLKAGGTGLNLTAATHVFHYDRWWNPAVEDQATDRAYRIGQRRAVQVYKLVCAGTVEEKVDALLERKRDLASRIVGTDEHWLTEMDDATLRELCALSADAAVAGEEADAGDERDDDVGAPDRARRRPARRAPADALR
jgi:superfamily II DNA or RNA helicase